MNIPNKELLTVKETAEIMGVTSAYVREMLNKAKYDNSIKLIGKKIGKEWRVTSKSVYEYIGVDKRKELYIKGLECKIEKYKIQIETLKNILKAAGNVII